MNAKESLRILQDFLRNHPIKDIELNHGIKFKFSGDLVIFDYDQIEAKLNEPYCWAARGLILNKNDWSVVSMGLGRFLNYGEGLAAPVDWNTAYAWEKIDGSLVNRFWYNNQWCYATRYQLPENLAINQVNGYPLTWEQLVKLAFKDFTYEQPKDETWALELCSPYNKVVVQHKEIFLKLLARRNLITLEEVSVEGHPLAPKAFKFAKPEEVKAFADTFPATENEGFVVCDQNFNRLKIKSTQYVSLHRLKAGLNSLKNLILLARSNDFEEVLINFPEYRADVEAIAGLINQMILQHEVAYEQFKDIKEQKDFALVIKAANLPLSDAMFKARSGKVVSIRHHFMTITDTQFVRLFKDQAEKMVAGKYLNDDE
jgi:hypothetical protein